MADATTADAGAGVVDEARSAAAGTRSAAKWLASALGALPGIAVLGAIVRAPGDQGFDSSDLALGIAFAAAGGLVAVIAFARVAAPVRLEDKDLKGFDLTRVPGQPYSSFRRLRSSLDDFRAVAAADEREVRAKTRAASEAKAAAAAAESAAVEAEAKSKAAPDDQALKAAATEARLHAEQADLAAEVTAATAAAAAETHKTWVEQFQRRDRIRAEAYRLKAADEVNDRFTLAQAAAVVAVALIAFGVYHLGLAPKPKAPEATAPTLVTLTPNAAGHDALGCSAPTVSALKVGGTDDAPTVITLPENGCASKTLTFTVTKDASLGTAKAADPVEAPKAG
jgi:protein involved in polysaccharide export with SLBB domain